MRLIVLALDGVFDTGLSVLLDVFHTANALALAQGAPRPPLEIGLVGVRRHVRTALGLTAPVEAPAARAKPDWLIVPALNAMQPESLVPALARHDVRDAVALLRASHADGIRIAGACVGTFLLAEAGLLDGREATTTWSLAPLFRERYPRAILDDARMIVDAGSVVTAGAALGHLDLALWLVRRASPALAAVVARFLIIDRRRSQAPYVIPHHLAHADPLVERFERWARAHLASGFSLQDAADALHVGPRTLQRRMVAVMGKSPLAFFQDLRVQHAQHLVSLGQDLGTIANEVGYVDPATLRTLLRRRLGRGVRELRAERA